jgi:hypothetical protein
MFVRFFAVLLAACLAASSSCLPAIAESTKDNRSYLCISDAATGFSYDKNIKRWKPTHFNVDNEKFVIRRPTADEEQSPFSDDRVVWVWQKFGKNDIDSYCYEEFNKYGFLKCDDIGYELSFNNITLRFQRIYPIGYVVSKYFRNDEGANTPSITIGSCNQF